MKRTGIIFLFLCIAFFNVAQDLNQSDVIKNGDEAMENLDLSTAAYYYSEVLYVSCNIHSISQLTTIWLIDDSMRIILNRSGIMRTCLKCLEDNVTEYGDTAIIKLLITYYTEGIGTNKNLARAANLNQRLEEIRNPGRVPDRQNNGKPPRDKTPMQFFAGYALNLKAPFGVTLGSVGKSLGWYLRVRSNLTFPEYSYVCDNVGIIDNWSGGFYQRLEDRKTKTFIGTGGMMIKVNPSFFLSFGAGYLSHEVCYNFQKIGEIEAVPVGVFWAKVDNSSFKGVALDLDGSFKIGKKMYGSIGCTVFHFSSVYANAGIGLFF